jgi:hypothetical protein
MRFRRKPRLTVTGVNFPVIGGGISWSEDTDERASRAQSERSAAFAELWKIAQDAHIGMRNNFDKADELSVCAMRLRVPHGSAQGWVTSKCWRNPVPACQP